MQAIAIPTELERILSRDPEIMGGALCFTGTRIPVRILLDNLAACVPMDEFFDAYPDLTQDQVRAVVDWEYKLARSGLGLENGW